MPRFSNVGIPLPHGRSNQLPDRIIVHAMGEFIDNLPAWDFLKKIGLSAHSLITPSGVNVRCRQDLQGAYHAKNNNTNTLGIEILVPGVHDYASFISKIEDEYITDVQYSAIVKQVKMWLDKFDIKDVLRHSDIDPNRKKDPGTGLNWQQFMYDIQ